uniref:VWFA domain-containing protein n=1 Tax=viral metagenome TaxID=1070528 RepID=A0A6C0LS76_9ZZZZ
MSNTDYKTVISEDNLIENTMISLLSTHELPELNIINENETFGILSIKMKKTKKTEFPTLLLFTVDITGSMNEPAYHNVSKLDVVKQTFKSMVRYMVSLDTTNIRLRVHAFNEEVEVVIDNMIVNKENEENILSIIQSLEADNSTNIEKALNYANDTITSILEKEPNLQVSHIFMTDGDPTAGECNPSKLANMVNNNFPNVFIGFGSTHNVLLLKKLSDYENCDYLFVDNMEKSSLVYGETLHRYIYPALKNVEIVLDNGFIYDWKTNTWVERLVEPIIVGEIEKIYHIKTTRPTAVCAELYGIVCSTAEVSDPNDYNMLSGELEHLESVSIIPALINVTTNKVNDDLTKYMFRQKTLELLFEAKSIVDKPQEKLFKDELKIFFKTMRMYMKTKNLSSDKFLINLCDDISIMYNSIGTQLGMMYTTARQTSQGRQYTYISTPTCKKNREEDNMNNDGNNFDDQLLTMKLTPAKLTRSRAIGKIDGSIINSNIISPPILISTHAISETDEIYNTNNMISPPSLIRGYFGNSNENENILFNSVKNISEKLDDDCDIDKYRISNNTTSCYATPSSLNTMSQVSEL